MPWLQLWARKDAAKPQVSPPRYRQHHHFHTERIRKERPCHACHLPVAGKASRCRVCKYVCHESCENAEGDRARFSDTSRQIHRQWKDGEARLFPEPRCVSPDADNNNRTRPRSDRMEIYTVTDRMSVLWIPPGAEADEGEAARALRTRFGRDYMLFNLTEPGGRLRAEHGGRVCDLAWRAGCAPPLEGLCSLCKKLDRWLDERPRHVAVLRARGRRERYVAAVSSYLRYGSICSPERRPEDLTAMRRFLEAHSSPADFPPSHRRYVEYFAALLSGSVKVNPSPLTLTHVTVVGAPAASHVFLKLYEGTVPVYTSNVYFLGAGARQFTATLGGSPGGVAVRGDVLLRCYARPPPTTSRSATPERSDRRLIFSCQFHTCAVSDFTIIFTKGELDAACHDERFPSDGSVEIQVAGARPSPAPTPSVRVHPADDPISRWDSLQEMRGEEEEAEAEEATVADADAADGGPPPIYATVSRRAGSPLGASMDSGISSAGRRQGSPSPGSRRRELDDLLDAMLKTVEELPSAPVAVAPMPMMPPPPPPPPPPPAPADADIPYHARPDSRPFTYGSPPSDAVMLRTQPGLSSPGLVRKLLEPRQLATARPTQRRPLEPRSPHEDSMTWLQRQQQRLRARQAARRRAAGSLAERPLPSARASASHRFDGYTSDTTAFADDDDEFGPPLRATAHHSHRSPSPPDRTSSRKYMTLERTTVRERSASPGLEPADCPVLREHSTVSFTDRSFDGNTTREESVSSWRSVSVTDGEGQDGDEAPRAATPAFPTAPRTPYPPATPPCRALSDPSSSSATPDDAEVGFARDTSRFWYKPDLTRDEAVALLRDAEAGAFLVRDSNSFPDAFGLAVKTTPSDDPSPPEESVRHFLVEPAPGGVRLKGRPEEPTFGSLSALVFQHSVTPLALPVRLRLPRSDPAPPAPAFAARRLLAAGAACSLLYVGGAGCEALTGPEAVARTLDRLPIDADADAVTDSTPLVVHFKVAAAGVTVTDSSRRLFFRRHYPVSAVSHCGLDPDGRTLNRAGVARRLFGFVARRSGSATDNECHVFAELDPDQPATAVVNFVSKVMLGRARSVV